MRDLTFCTVKIGLVSQNGQKIAAGRRPYLALRGRGWGRRARLPVAGARWGYNHIPQLGLLAAHGGAGRKRGGALHLRPARNAA